jgi:eukaryotic-like serine/threonine-protein kinase
MFSSQHLRGFLELPRVESDEERRSLWRQAMATLARAALEQQPVPLEGLDPAQLLEAVRAVFKANLLDDLDWLAPSGAAAAIYELASAIPVGPERRQLGRRVLGRLYEGDVETFVVLATSLAADSKRMLTGAPIRARMALALELPLGSGVRIDALALMLISRAELRREWLTEPASGSLPSRRLAARLLERAARESARRAAEGDAGSLAAFSLPAVRAAWQLLFHDRESLVWRHVATARGLLAKAIPEFAEEIENQLDSKLTPTEWRRAAVSLGASIALDSRAGLQRCRALLESETFRSDPGLSETMIFGLGRASEVEPESVEDLLEQLAKIGGIEVAEALVELRRERIDSEVGMRAAAVVQDKLQKWLSLARGDDDGRIALCEALISELADPRPHLRTALDRAVRRFSEQDARQAFSAAQSVFQAAIVKITELEMASDAEPAGRRQSFRIMREVDAALLETAALPDLLSLGGTAQAPNAAAALGDLFERLTAWLIRLESKPVQTSGAVPHLSLRMRRLRTLLHVVDADGSYGEDITGQRRARRLRIARMLLGRARSDAPSPLRRIVCAAVARALDALVRDELCELSDVLIAVADHVSHVHDIAAVAEASMLPDFQKSLGAYAELVRASDKPEASGRNARHAIDSLKHFAQVLPWAGTLRVSALRSQLLLLARRLEDVAAARTLSELAEGAGHDHLAGLEAVIGTLCQLTSGARRRVVPRAAPQVHEPALAEFTRTIERAEREGPHAVQASLPAVEETLERDLPLAVAKTVLLVLKRVAESPVSGATRGPNSFAPPSPKEAPLPPWLTGRRTIGGFYVLHPLGAGGVGSVFVVTRAEERHREDAVRFALKVPDYNAEAARTLSEEEFLNLFRQEAGALLALPQHPNIARFVTFDAGARPKPILVMELVEGPTLERVIERGDLDINRALELLDGIGAGLQGMHRVEIGHLDVKPSNVIMRPVANNANGGTELMRPVLVDFGLAGRNLRPGCATGPYGAPEIWGLVPPDYTPRPMDADVYAYACLAYETLTGDTLFDGPSELAVIQAHLNHDGFPDKLKALCAKKGMQTLGELIGNGLRRHPGERISVQEMREGFHELRQSLSKLEWPLHAA